MLTKFKPCYLCVYINPYPNKLFYGQDHLTTYKIVFKLFKLDFPFKRYYELKNSNSKQNRHSAVAVVCDAV